MRRQPYAETNGAPTLDPSVVQVAVCPTCKTALDFEYDAIGRLRERCATCRGRRTRPNPAKPQVSQAALTNAIAPDASQLLPAVAPGQLRCQQCAKGVEGRARFCDDCREAGRSAAAQAVVGGRPAMTPERRLEINAAIGAAMRARRAVGGMHFQHDRQCPCGIAFRPTSPNQKYHAKDCPARRAA